MLVFVCAGCAAPGGALPSATSAALGRPTNPPASPTMRATRTSALPPTPTGTPTPPPSATPTAPPTATDTATSCGETHGQIIHAQLRSGAFHNAQTYRVYLPACYTQQANRRYPTLYL